MKTIRLLGVTVHDMNRQETADFFAQALAGQTQITACTPNPEIVLYAHRHPEYLAVLNRSQLALPDGKGLQLFGGVKNRVTGVDAAGDLLALADKQHKTVCCVVRADGRSTAAQIQTAVQAMAPQAHITVIESQKQNTDVSGMLQKIAESQPDIILVGLGFPEQELWLDASMQRIPTAKIGMAIGGAFDFWTGTAVRAPRLFQTLGIEWLWRLVHQPSRIKRIWNAVVVFPLTVLFSHKD